MKKACLIFVFNIVSIICSAQNLKVDSLLNILSVSLEDTAKVNALNTLSEFIYRSDPERAINYGTEALELSTKLNYQNGQAVALNNIGNGYFCQSNYVEASLQWEKSLSIYESTRQESGIAQILSNLGAAYLYMGNEARSIDYFLQSLKIAEEEGDSLRIATCLLNIGSTYSWKPETIELSLPYYLRALSISEAINYKDAIGIISFNLGDYYFQKELYDSALLYYKKSLPAYENTIDVAPSLNDMGKIFALKGDFQSAIKYQKEALEIAEEMNGKLEMSQIYLGLADTYQKQGNLQLAIDQFNRAKEIATEIESNYEIKDAYEGLANVYAELSDFKKAFTYLSLLNEIEKTIYSIETEEKIETLQFSYQLDKKEVEIENLEQLAEIEQLRTKRQKLIRNISLVGFAILLVFAFLLYLRYKHKAETNIILDKQNAEIEGLLLNILPKETVEELQKDGHATPRYYDQASVLFTDFKGFTNIAEGLKPHELIAELNSFFNAFDDIIEKYCLEKIKTIGDAYMCAGGIPTENETHPLQIVKAGLDMQEYMQLKNEQRAKVGKQVWELRVGIHTGPIVAGVVGKKKYAYDIWGDTVNIASRMESNGEPGKVNISSATYDLVKGDFNCHYRGKIGAKNKGYIDMYFIESMDKRASFY